MPLRGLLQELVVYVSGPMTGLPEYNYPNFMRVEKQLLDLGLGIDVINPAHTGVQEGWVWQDYMKHDLKLLLDKPVNVLILLEGWESSRGARLEKLVADELGVLVLTEKEFFESVIIQHTFT